MVSFYKSFSGESVPTSGHNPVLPNCCAFHSRCKYADERCRTERPQPEQVGEQHWCACFHREAAQAEREEVLSV